MIALTRWFDKANKWLEGWPDPALTIALLVAALILVLIAFRGSSTAKALAAAYVFLP